MRRAILRKRELEFFTPTRPRSPIKGCFGSLWAEPARHEDGSSEKWKEECRLCIN
jgi:hypothetical protein